MSDFFTPVFRALDSNGDPISGAKLNFYETGTATPQNTYPTAADRDAATNANANPVVADANGYFGRIFLETDTKYRVQLTDASDVQIWQEDLVDPAQMASSSLAVRLKQVASNPIDYGAVGDGIADESSYVSSAISNATGTVDLLGKTYKCDSQIALTSGLRLINGTLDFSGCSDTDYILIQGSAGSAVTLTADASKADTTLTVTGTSGLSAGDVCELSSSATWDGTNGAGELLIVQAAVTTTLTPSAAIHGSYTTANSAQYVKLTTVDDVILEDLTIIGGSDATAKNLVLVDSCKGVSIRNCFFDSHADQVGVQVKSSVDVTVTGCRFFGNSVTTDCIGVKTTESNSHIVVRDCHMSFIGQAVWAGEDSAAGVTRAMKVADCTFDGVEATGCVKIDAMVEDFTLSGCSFYGDGTGTLQLVYGNDVKLLNNTLKSCAGFYLDPKVTSADVTRDNYLIQGNRFDNVTEPINVNPTTTGALEYLRVLGNASTSTTNAFLEVNGSSGLQLLDVLIADNMSDAAIDFAAAGNNTSDCDRIIVRGNNVSHIHLDWSGAFHELTVAHNICSPSATHGIYVKNGASAVTNESWIITGNQCNGSSASHGIFLEVDEQCDNLVVSGNICEPAGAGSGLKLQIDETSAHYASTVISGNTFSTTTGSALWITTAAEVRNIVIANNACRATGNGVVLDVDGYVEGCAITGNALYHQTTTGDVIDLDGGAASAIKEVIVSGNSIYGGDYGIELTNHTNVAQDGNLFANQNTGDVSGALGLDGDHLVV